MIRLRSRITPIRSLIGDLLRVFKLWIGQQCTERRGAQHVTELLDRPRLQQHRGAGDDRGGAGGASKIQHVGLSADWSQAGVERLAAACHNVLAPGVAIDPTAEVGEAEALDAEGRSRGADHDGAGILKSEGRAVEHVPSTGVGEGIEIGAADMFGIRLLHLSLPAGSTTVMPRPVAVLIRSKASGSDIDGDQPNLSAIGRRRLHQARPRPPASARSPSAIAFAVLKNGCARRLDDWLTTRTVAGRDADHAFVVVDRADDAQHRGTVRDPNRIGMIGSGSDHRNGWRQVFVIEDPALF